MEFHSDGCSIVGIWTIETFEDLLQKDETGNIHQRNLQILAIETYKVKNYLASDMMEDIFHFAEKTYKLRKSSTLKIRCNLLVHLCTVLIFSFAPEPGSKYLMQLKMLLRWNFSKEKWNFVQQINGLVGFVKCTQAI